MSMPRLTRVQSCQGSQGSTDSQSGIGGTSHARFTFHSANRCHPPQTSQRIGQPRGRRASRVEGHHHGHHPGQQRRPPDPPRRRVLDAFQHGQHPCHARQQRMPIQHGGEMPANLTIVHSASCLSVATTTDRLGGAFYCAGWSPQPSLQFTALPKGPEHGSHRFEWLRATRNHRAPKGRSPEGRGKRRVARATGPSGTRRRGDTGRGSCDRGAAARCVQAGSPMLTGAEHRLGPTLRGGSTRCGRCEGGEFGRPDLRH
jgi:hypothetical protein